MSEGGLNDDGALPGNTKKSSLWSRYKRSIKFKSDLKYIFVRSHKLHATLDGARAITILGMVLFHVLFGVARLLDENVDPFIQNFPSYLDWMWQAQGSDPLFVMTGLLVTYTLLREYDKTQTLDLMRFYKRRIMRIYPLFILALLLFFPASKHSMDYLLSNLVFISNYVPGHKPIVPVAWSLEVQMLFYLLLPFLCLLVYAVRCRIALLVGLCFAAVAYRYWVVVSQPELYETPFYQIIYDRDFARLLSDQLYYDFDVRIGGFLMGTLVAYIHHYYGQLITTFFKRHLFINAVVLGIALFLLAWSFNYPMHKKDFGFYHPFDPDANLMFLAFNRYLYSFAMSILLLLALCPAGISRMIEWFFSWRIWHPVAQLIYPIYLFHFPFIIVGAVVALGTTDKDSIIAVSIPQVFGIYFWTVFFTIIFGALVHIYIEKPFLRFRDT